MFRKLAIIMTIVAITVAYYIFVYLDKNQISQQTLPLTEIKMISGTTYIESGMTLSGNNWNPDVMRTGKAIQANTGVTVTVSTNGPSVRSMSPDELREFQKKIQGK